MSDAVARSGLGDWINVLLAAAMGFRSSRRAMERSIFGRSREGKEGTVGGSGKESCHPAWLLARTKNRVV